MKKFLTLLLALVMALSIVAAARPRTRPMTRIPPMRAAKMSFPSL